jgi:Photosynthetic reaction centre cytochrome C subunit.
MTERAAAVLIAFSSVALLTVACVATSTNPAPATVTPATVPTANPTTANAVRTPGQRPQLSDSARARRDSINAFRRDSLMGVVLASIAGKENMPAESVFKNIKIFKGVPAGRVVNIMGRGFSPALGVSCGFCHTIGAYEKEDKEEKQTARVMFAMVKAINADYLSKLPKEADRPAPVVNCSTCHRGMTRPGGGTPGGGSRPGI